MGRTSMSIRLSSNPGPIAWTTDGTTCVMQGSPHTWQSSWVKPLACCLPHSDGSTHVQSPGTTPRRRGKAECRALLSLGLWGWAEAFSWSPLFGQWWRGARAGSHSRSAVLLYRFSTAHSVFSGNSSFVCFTLHECGWSLQEPHCALTLCRRCLHPARSNPPCPRPADTLGSCRHSLVLGNRLTSCLLSAGLQLLPVWQDAGAGVC